jgi:ABC-type branched-subunit amino acid transport system substrate-binding protein
MNMPRAKRNRRNLAASLPLVLALLACSLAERLTPPGPEEIVEPPAAPTVTQTQQPATPPTPPPQPTSPPAAGGQLVLHQPFAIVVAYAGPQTGTGSALFAPLLQAGQKAIEDYGLVHGFGVNLIGLDDNCTQTGGQSAAQQIVADEHLVAVLGPVCSNSAMGALPVLEAADVVMVSGSATTPGLASYGPSVFHRTLLDDDVVTALGYPSQIYIEDLPSVQAWLSDFAAWGGGLLETGLNHYSPYQYDAMGILLRALDLSSVLQGDGALLIDRDGLRAAVRGTANYPGITGAITFETDGDRQP